jgi:hypothetical protein
MPNEKIKLSSEEKTKLINLKADMSFLDGELSRADRAGIDVSELRVQYDKMKKLRAGILKEYA